MSGGGGGDFDSGENFISNSTAVGAISVDVAPLELKICRRHPQHKIIVLSFHEPL